MKRSFSLLLTLLFIFVCTLSAQQIAEQLKIMPGVTGVEKLESDHYVDKYVLFFEQPVDHQHPDAGKFTQRIIVSHVGADRPTVMVTEGYGAAYALNPRYQEELSKLLNANMIFVEHRYFLESTPEPCNWDYLTAENAAFDLHAVNQAFKSIYSGKWATTGISKGGQTTCLYRAYFPDDVDFSVPYVAPLNHGVEDGRHEPFIDKNGSRQDRKRIKEFQTEVLKRKSEMIPLLTAYCGEKELKYRITMPEVLDYCVLEFPFALWQWGAPTADIPAKDADTQALFDYLVKMSDPNYFAEDQPYIPFFVQAARELGYYGYDTKPFKKYLTIKSPKGYLNQIMLPADLVDTIEYRPESSDKVYQFLKNNDPKMIFIYGEVDPWSATRVPDFKGKKNMQIYIQPGGSHSARINTMPEAVKARIIAQLNTWLAE